MPVAVPVSEAGAGRTGGGAVPADTPVLVGWKAVEQRRADPAAALDAVGLMVDAARGAVAGPTAAAVLGAVDWIGATDGSARVDDPARLVARALGLPHAHTVLARVGVMQQTLVSEACRRVQAGEARLALVVGGEARYRQVRAQAAGVELATPSAGTDPDEVLVPRSELVLRCEVAAGLHGAPGFYALLDSEWRHRHGWSPEVQRHALGRLYARFAQVAAANPHAVRRERYDAAFLSRGSEANPMLAFPYTKLMVTTWTVDQAAALVFTTAGAAAELGIPRGRWLFPLVAVESNFMAPMTARARLTQPSAMPIMAGAAADAAGVDTATVEVLELYSCFPVAVQVAAEGLGVPEGRDLTVTGGMSFAGGPFNNFVFQAMAAVAERLAAGPGQRGLVSCVSGLYTKQGFTVLGTAPPAAPFAVVDVTARVEAGEPVLAVEDRPAGPATVAAATVLFAAGAPSHAVAVAELAGGRRTVARSDDPAVMARCMDEDVVGRAATVAEGSFSLPPG
ncbi:MAG TPA: hypothetical protein VMB72_07285 [Acidimicrobiales bacterium]|nr:hypothetical protein [Acidimicrobiales bacterium]